MRLRYEDSLAGGQRGAQTRTAPGSVVATLGRDLERESRGGKPDYVFERRNKGTPRAVAGREEHRRVAQPPARATEGRGAGEPGIQRGGYGTGQDSLR